MSELTTHFRSDGRTVHSPIFETSVLKIQDGREEDSTTSENLLVKFLHLHDLSEVEIASYGSSFITEGALRKL